LPLLHIETEPRRDKGEGEHPVRADILDKKIIFLLQGLHGSIRIKKKRFLSRPTALGLMVRGNTVLTLYGLRATINETTPSAATPTNPAASGSRLETKVLRMAWKPILPRRGFWLVCAALLLAGCQEQEQIRSYDVPKESVAVGAVVEKQRLLAVMVPCEKYVWFFKIMGTEQAVGEQVPAFDRFLASIHFTDREREPIKWIVPEGWKQIPGAGELYARLRKEGDGSVPEITISQFPPKAKDPRPNIDRWRNQLGLGPIGDDELKKLVGNVKVDGVEGTRVDFTGGARKRGGPVFARGRPFRFAKPDDWEERPPDNHMGVYRPAVFLVRDGEHLAEVSVVPLAGHGGGARDNVNRWRRQLGLEPIDDAQLQKDLRQLDVADGKAPYIDLKGRDPTGPQRILGAWIVHGGRTWFIKMKGSPELVGKQQAAFEAFVQSIRFADGQGAAHE
jgi:hypothetical protein